MAAGAFLEVIVFIAEAGHLLDFWLRILRGIMHGVYLKKYFTSMDQASGPLWAFVLSRIDFIAALAHFTAWLVLFML